MKSVVVIGGGVIGLSCAYELRKAGLEVAVVDYRIPQFPPASWGNAGMIVPSHFTPLAAPGMIQMGLKMMWSESSPFGIAKLDVSTLAWASQFARSCTPAHVERCAPILAQMHMASRERYIELQEEIGDFGLTTLGLLNLCKDPKVLDEESHLVAQARAFGIKAMRLNRDETAAMDPGVQMDVCGSVLFQHDGHLNPMALLERLEGALNKMGWEHHLIEGYPEADPDPLTECYLQERDHVVLAAGVWSPAHAPWKMPLLGGKGYSFIVPTPPVRPNLCSLLTEARVAVTPMGDGVRFGGTMELGPPSLSINENRLRGIRESIPRYFPQFTADKLTGHEVWAGLRPCSPDGMPYLGQVDRTVIATGHGMMGISLAPVTAQLVTDIILGEKPRIDLSLMNPQRYA